MGQIPADATLWDCGDWIDWHRNGTKAPEPSCASHEDLDAKLALLQNNLLRAARNYNQLTGQHLPIYGQIARVHAARHYCIPMIGNDPLAATGVLLLSLSPTSETQAVDIDMSMAFTSVLVVRIDSNFAVEARMVTRRRLGECASGVKTVPWRMLPQGS